MDTSPEERNAAALAQGVGTISALPVWLKWRSRSAFVRAHAAQSMAFDGLTAAALVIVAALVMAAGAGLLAAVLHVP
jgi:uncharacterized membrane protein